MQRPIPVIIIVSILILLIVGGYFLGWPKYQEFGDKKLEVEGKDTEIRQKQEYLSKLEVFSDRLSEYSDELAEIDFALPTEPSIAALFIFFQKISSENGLILKDTDLGELFSSETPETPETPGTPGERIQKMPFSISVTGSYPALKNFLSVVYRNTRLIEVNSISFSFPEEEEGLFTFNLALETHAYQPKAEKEEAETPE
ncbi:type 4a pilus biogenesis protein PilO [Patescibacteria group bacterium]|nr:type 4a pilus biogenesis protein PilO [Patescibacteria group bacterium]